MSVNAALDRDQEIPAWVEFELRAEEDVPASRLAGHPIFKDVEYALITPPYSKDCVEKKVEKWLETTRKQVREGRTSQRVLEYNERKLDAWRAGQEMPLDGTSIKNCPIYSPAQIKTLLAANMRTVEELAVCNDEGLRRIGMGGVDIRNKARAWLKSTKDHGGVSMENAALLKENEQLKTSVAGLERRVELLVSQLESKSTMTQSFESVDHSGIAVSDILDEPSFVDPMEELRAQVFAKTGKKPHPFAKEATLRAKLEG